MDIYQFIEDNIAEHRKFENVKNKLSTRSDLHAFILLNQIMPSHKNIICAVDYNEIYLDIDLEELKDKINEEQLLDLIRCGVSYSSSSHCLYMFV